MRRTLIAIAIAAAVAVPSIGQAKTFRWAAQGDILTFDPHSQNEGMTIAANSYVYEPLVDYDKSFKVVPRLATEWEQVSPTLYRFRCAPASSSTTARPSPPTTRCSRSTAPWRRPRTTRPTRPASRKRARSTT